MRKLWLLGIAVFLGLLFWQLWAKQPYFFYTAHDFYQQAQEARRYGDHAKALRLAQKAHEREPQNWDYADFLAWRYLEAKQPQEALDLFQREWAARPTAVALRGQVQALEQLDKRDEALQLLEKYLAAHPQDNAFLQLAADLAAGQPGSQAQALGYYERLYRLQPQDRQVRRRLLELLIAAGRHADAIPLQEQVVAEAPDNPQALHQLALLYHWQRDYQAAVPLYQKLLDLEANNLALRLEAAQNAAAAHNLEQALAHYLQLYAQTRGQKEYALVLARLWSQKGQHAQAAAVLAPLMAQQPSLEERRRYALELLLARNYGQALKAYRQAWEAGDSQKETILNLARLHAQQQQFAAAAKFWDEAQRRQLLEGELRREAALAYSYARRYRDAVAVLAPVDRRDPKILLFLGQMHFYQEQWDRAAHYYQQYLEVYPQDTAVREQLAQALSFLPHRLAEAAEQYRQNAALSGDPRFTLQQAAVLLQMAQNASNDLGLQNEASAHWAAAAALLRQIPATGLPPRLVLEQSRLLLWLGDLETALERLEIYLARFPQDRQAQLDKARILIYLQRGAQATEVLHRLPPATPAAVPAPRPPGPDSGGLEGRAESETSETPVHVSQQAKPAADPNSTSADPREIPQLFLEAALADRNWPEALRRAWQLYLSQLPRLYPLPRTWPAARRLMAEPPNLDELSPAARVAIARALCHHPQLEQEPELVQIAVDLCVENVWSRRKLGPDQHRYYQASLLILAYLLPRINQFDRLQELVHRLPGIRPESPEYLATLNYFYQNLGRQGGKLQYLLQTLKDRQERQQPRSPGDFIFLAALAAELGDPRTASRYCDQALRLRPGDQRLAAWRLQILMAANETGQVLKDLEDQWQTPETALALAQTYLARHQYEGAVAALGRIAPEHPVWPQAQLLLVQAYRSLQDYPAALAALQDLQSRGGAGPAALMARAQILEAQNDRAGAQAAYEAVMAQAPDILTVQAAKARLARFRGDWAGAYRHFQAALQQDPQNIELLNELEQIKEQMRPTLAARNLPAVWRGERRPEEALRPWQFSRFDRRPGSFSSLPGSSGTLLPLALPLALIPETTLFRDHNHLKALETRLAGAFWLSRLLPVQLALGYRIYQQHHPGPGTVELHPGANPFLRLPGVNRTTWERAEASLALGPLMLGDKLRLSGGLSGRRYWKNLKQEVVQVSHLMPVVPLDVISRTSQENRDTRNRLLGSASLVFSPQPQTDLTLSYSRQDIFDQDPAIYPRLYQQVIRLDTLPLITLDQIGLAASHQFFPGLSYQANLAQAFFSDRNQRFSLYQGLRWQVLNQPRMHLDLSPSYYLACYRQQHDSYFSPQFYQALGVSLDFDRQLFQMDLFDWPASRGIWSWLSFLRFFRLPTLVLQTTGQVVDNDGRWGPAVAVLAGLESEPFQNFYVGLHYFYFKEWATNYWLNSLSFGLRWRF